MRTPDDRWRQNFNPSREIKRRFGADVLRMSQEGEERKAQRQPHTARTWRRTTLASFSSEWPGGAERSLLMTPDADAPRDGNSHFVIKYTAELEVRRGCSVGAHGRALIPACWQRLSAEYERVIGSHDAETMAHFLRRHPYHVDALLQMVCRVSRSWAD